MTLSSMTAYGFGEASANDLNYSLEVRSLNSRYIEVNVRMPRHLVALESDMIGAVKKTFSRGKVDIFVDIARDGGQRDLPEIDRDAVRHYARLFDELQETLLETKNSAFASLRDPALADFFRLDGVLLGTEKKGRGSDNTDEHREPLLAALADALKVAREARDKEGAALVGHLEELLTQLEGEREHVEAKRDVILKAIHDNYHRKIETLFATVKGTPKTGGVELSEERIAQEIIILTDKADIDEENARLKTHCKEFRNHLEKKEPVGRKLDFLCQEMHREVNTMSNKLVQTEVSAHTLTMKQIIERIRQQVQNIE